MKQSGDMCTYGITMSVPIRTMVGRHHSRRDIERKFFELSVTKKFDQYTFPVGRWNAQFRIWFGPGFSKKNSGGEQMAEGAVCFIL